jgi:hypothetical protein
MRDGAGRQWDATVVRVVLEMAEVQSRHAEGEQVPEPAV